MEFQVHSQDMSFRQLLRDTQALLEATRIDKARAALSKLPSAGEEDWDDGTHVQWHESPFPFRRAPPVPSKLTARAQVRSIPLEGLHGSQKRVTAKGVIHHLDQKPVDEKDLPLVYKERDGSHTIGDGHHRLVAASLRGQSHAQARVVDVPDEN